MTPQLVFPCALFLATACHERQSGPSSVVLPAGGVVAPVRYQAPLVQLQRVEGSSFIEIQEVRARDDGRLFYCTGVQGLLVVDANDPAHMRSVAQLASSLGSPQFPRCQHVTWDGDAVYMTSRGDELQPVPFVALFDLATRREIATFQLQGKTFEGIAASSSKAYVAMHQEGLLVLERSGHALVQRGVATGLQNARGVDVMGSRVYVADGIGGLAVVDVSDPANPRVLGRAQTGGDAGSVVVQGSLAYVAAGSAGLAVVDVSDSAAPRLVGTAATPGNAVQVSIAQGRAWVADWNDVRVFDVSNPARPRLIAVEHLATDSPLSRVLGIAARGDNGFFGEWTGMYSYELHSERAAPHLSVAQRTIEFGVVAPGRADAFALAVKNEGNARLLAWSVAVADSSAFKVDRTWLLLDPGQEAAVEITFQPSSASFQRGTLVIDSDDPAARSLGIPLTGNRPGASVGEPAPEVAVGLTDGTLWQLSKQTGKTVVLAYFATF